MNLFIPLVFDVGFFLSRCPSFVSLSRIYSSSTDGQSVCPCSKFASGVLDEDQEGRREGTKLPTCSERIISLLLLFLL